MKNTFEKLVAAMKESIELTYKSIDQITAVQLKAIQDNAKIGMYTLNTATDIKDLDSFKNYLESQIAVTQYVSDNTAVDAQEITELSQSFTTSAKGVVEKSIISKQSLMTMQLTEVPFIIVWTTSPFLCSTPIVSSYHKRSPLTYVKILGSLPR